MVKFSVLESAVFNQTSISNITVLKQSPAIIILKIIVTSFSGIIYLKPVNLFRIVNWYYLLI